MTRFQIAFFGCGAIIFLAFILTSKMSSLHMVFYTDWVSVLDTLTYLSSVAIQIVFLIKYDSAILPNHWFFHYSIALMVTDKVWLWLTVTMDRLDEVVARNANGSFELRILHTNSSVNPSFQTAIYTCLVFLEPFFVEFLTIAMGVLIHLWNFTSEQEQSSSEDDERNEENLVSSRYNDYSYVINNDGRYQTSINDNSDTIVSEHTSLLGLRFLANRHRSSRRVCSEKVKIGTFTSLSAIIAMGFLISNLIFYTSYFG